MLILSLHVQDRIIENQIRLSFEWTTTTATTNKIKSWKKKKSNEIVSVWVIFCYVSILFSFLFYHHHRSCIPFTSIQTAKNETMNALSSNSIFLLYSLTQQIRLLHLTVLCGFHSCTLNDELILYLDCTTERERERKQMPNFFFGWCCQNVYEMRRKKKENIEI